MLFANQISRFTGAWTWVGRTNQDMLNEQGLWIRFKVNINADAWRCISLADVCGFETKPSPNADGGGVVRRCSRTQGYRVRHTCIRDMTSECQVIGRGERA